MLLSPVLNLDNMRRARLGSSCVAFSPVDPRHSGIDSERFDVPEVEQARCVLSPDSSEPSKALAHAGLDELSIRSGDLALFIDLECLDSRLLWEREVWFKLITSELPHSEHPQ